MAMRNASNRRIYRAWAPIYNSVFGRAFRDARRRTIEALELRAGESLLIPGVGTGLDLPMIPRGVHVVGLDLSREMLAQTSRQSLGPQVCLIEADAQHLPFATASFDAVLLNLVLSVVPDAGIAFGEAWRTLRPGGRMVLFDKFRPEDQSLTAARRMIGRIAEALGTDPNRRLDDIIRGAAQLTVARDSPALLRGTYRLIRLDKA